MRYVRQIKEVESLCVNTESERRNKQVVTKHLSYASYTQPSLVA